MGGIAERHCVWPSVQGYCRMGKGLLHIGRGLPCRRWRHGSGHHGLHRLSSHHWRHGWRGVHRRQRGGGVSHRLGHLSQQRCYQLHRHIAWCIMAGWLAGWLGHVGLVLRRVTRRFRLWFNGVGNHDWGGRHALVIAILPCLHRLLEMSRFQFKLQASVVRCQRLYLPLLPLQLTSPISPVGCLAICTPAGVRLHFLHIPATIAIVPPPLPGVLAGGAGSHTSTSGSTSSGSSGLRLAGRPLGSTSSGTRCPLLAARWLPWFCPLAG